MSDSRRDVRGEASQYDVINMADDWRDVQQRMRRDDFRSTVASVYQQPRHIRRRLALCFALVNVGYRIVCYSSVSSAI